MIVPCYMHYYAPDVLVTVCEAEAKMMSVASLVEPMTLQSLGCQLAGGCHGGFWSGSYLVGPRYTMWLNGRSAVHVLTLTSALGHALRLASAYKLRAYILIH